jgi:hypothetical protein
MSGEYTTKLEADVKIEKLEDLLWYIKQLI